MFPLGLYRLIYKVCMYPSEVNIYYLPYLLYDDKVIIAVVQNLILGRSVNPDLRSLVKRYFVGSVSSFWQGAKQTDSRFWKYQQGAFQERNT